MAQNNKTITVYDEIRHDFISPLVGFLFIALHMTMTCYLTTFLWLLVLKAGNGPADLISFIIDWHLIAILTLPILYSFKRLFTKPLALFILFILLLGFLGHFGQHILDVFANIDTYFKIQDYDPILFQLFH